jgi:uncharacterized membrane protein YgcG
MVYQNGPKLVAPMSSRPLTRVMARARSPSMGKRLSSPSSGTGGNGHIIDAYRMEVNEYIVRPGSPTGNLVGPAIPCVTVRDMHTFIPDKKQRRVWIPVAVCDELAKALKQCRQEGEKGGHDVSKLTEQTFQCPVTKKVCEIERIQESTRLRTYMDVTKDCSLNGGFVEVIELRNELMSRLVKFLDDVATRYRRINTQMVIPSLYSYSGERRFYYDLRETRWGLRLHISQVTDLHRNVIGIPLEAVVAFRDRLNQAIDFLGLEEEKRQERNERRGSKSRGGRRRGSDSRKENTSSGSAGGGGSSRRSRNRRQGRRKSSRQGKALEDKKTEPRSSETEVESGEKKPSVNEEDDVKVKCELQENENTEVVEQESSEKPNVSVDIAEKGDQTDEVDDEPAVAGADCQESVTVKIEGDAEI